MADEKKPKKASATWLGHPILDAEHVHDLERDAALNEFHHGMPRAQAETKALSEYRRNQHLQAAAHHLAHMKAAHALGDMEASQLHHDQYVNHMKQLGFDPMAEPPPALQVHAKEAAPHYGFKSHGADDYLVQPKEDEEKSKETETKKSEPDLRKVAEGLVTLALLMKGDVIPFRSRAQLEREQDEQQIRNGARDLLQPLMAPGQTETPDDPLLHVEAEAKNHIDTRRDAANQPMGSSGRSFTTKYYANTTPAGRAALHAQFVSHAKHGTFTPDRQAQYRNLYQAMKEAGDPLPKPLQ